MTLLHLIALVLATSSLVSAQFPARGFTNPVQPPGFANDPDLTTHRPLAITTPSEAPSDDVDSTSDVLLTIETIAPTPSTSSPPFAPSTPTSSASSSTDDAQSQNSSLTTITGTRSAKQSASSSTSNPASVPTAFANAAVGLIAIVGLAMAL